MFSQLLSAKDRRKVSTSYSSLVSHNRVTLVEAYAKVYHAKFGAEPVEWQYFNQKGKVVFGRDEDLGSSSGIPDAERYWFRLVDPLTGKVNWLFPVPENLVYHTEKPFFHVFNGRSRMWGLLFDNDIEGNAFGQTVKHYLPSSPIATRKTSTKTRPTMFRLRSLRSKNNSTLSVTEASPQPTITPAMISMPRTNSFSHLAHIGLNRDGEVEGSEGVDPSWTRIVTERQNHNPHRSTIMKDIGCFQGFI
ncbi:proline-rich protein [Moniliophthora roreri MCA 2997]|uniref:Proline-rich protein n=1 Tax=Moniliophthora roreri (strain MCA 2997) TaxID=1381753 RepID=V2YZ91_MONRO|nr:proline-rich protein [Moniliophthora roreri MCA 2997]